MKALFFKGENKPSVKYRELWKARTIAASQLHKKHEKGRYLHSGLLVLSELFGQPVACDTKIILYKPMTDTRQTTTIKAGLAFI